MKKTLIIEIQKGGLGDHLFYSHLPRIAKQTYAFDVVLISNKSQFRNQDYKKLIWELNPYVDGFTDDSGIFHFSTYYTDTQNLLDTLMLLYGLEDNKRMHEPEIYYQPVTQTHLKGAVVFDPNFISYTGDLRSNELIEEWFNQNDIQVNYQMVVLGNRFIAINDKPVLSANSIFDFCDILSSIDSVYCFTTGTATLAAALKVKTNVFYGKGHEKGYRHSLQNKYIYLGSDYRVIDKFKKMVFQLFHLFNSKNKLT